MAVALEQHIGSRSAQEDAQAIVFEREGDATGDLLMLIADGMGGHVGGATASNMAIERFRSAFLSQSPNRSPKERLQEALSHANAALRKETESTPKLKGMGTTLIAAWKHGDGLLWLSVGDSPLYLYRAGQLRRLNVDHSFFGELMDKVRQGRITLAEAQGHPKRNALRSALTGGEVRLVDINNIGLQINDTLIAASDGLDTLKEKELCQVLEAYHRASPSALCQKLISATLECGNPKQDNISVIAYLHGAHDRTMMQPSNWTKLSLANRFLGNWQVATLSAVAILLIVSIAVMVAIKTMSGPEKEEIIPPIVSQEQIEQPAQDNASLKAEPSSQDDASEEEAQVPQSALDGQEDPTQSGVAATLGEAPKSEAGDE